MCLLAFVILLVNIDSIKYSAIRPVPHPFFYSSEHSRSSRWNIFHLSWGKTFIVPAYPSKLSSTSDKRFIFYKLYLIVVTHPFCVTHLFVQGYNPGALTAYLLPYFVCIILAPIPFHFAAGVGLTTKKVWLIYPHIGIMVSIIFCFQN